MADRININPSTEGGGPDVLTDTITNLNAASLSPPAEAQRSKIGFGGDAVFIDVSAATPLPVTGTQLTTLHTDLAALLTELAQKLEPSDLNLLATAAKQDVAHADLGAILAKLSADPATQTTLAAVLAKLSSDPATQTTLASVLAKLTTTAGSPLVVRLSDGSAYLNLATTSDRLKVDVGGSLPAGTNNIGDVDVLTLPPLPAGSNAIGSVSVSNLPGDPPTATNQASTNTKLDTLHTDVGAAGTSPPALAASASGLIGWLRKIVDTLTGTLAVSIAAPPLPPAAATAYPIAAGTGNNQITSVAGRLMGFTIAETTGTTGATVRLYSGTDNTGTRLSTIALAANESVRDWFGPQGITVGASGVFVERASGTSTVTVYQAA